MPSNWFFRQEKGFTLIEVLASVGILLLLAAVIVEGYSLLTLAVQKSTALNLAKEAMEEVKGKSWQEVKNRVGISQAVLFSSGQYRRQIKLEYYQGKPSLVQATVTVGWQTSIYRGGRKQQEEVTLQLVSLLSELSSGGSF